MREFALYLPLAR